MFTYFVELFVVVMVVARCGRERPDSLADPYPQLNKGIQCTLTISFP